MKKKIFLAFCSAIFFLLPSLSQAECTNVGSFSSFTLEGNNTVILYSGSMPVVRFDIQNCDVKPTSRIRLIQTNVCDGDAIMIDGNRCIMMEIKPIGP